MADARTGSSALKLNWAAVVATVGALSLLGACRTTSEPAPSPRLDKPRASADALNARPSPAAVPSASPPADNGHGPEKAVPAARLPEGKGPFLIDELVDVAPAGPATAHASGVVMVDRNDKLAVLGLKALPSAAKSAETPIATIERSRSDFVPYARGPAVVGKHAYWVSQGRLVRRLLDGDGELEVLAKDARNGTRVVGGEGEGGAPLVAYITTSDAQGTPRGRLWLGNGKTLELTPEGAGTSSIALAGQKDSWLAITLDGRSGMTPLHVRRVHRQGSDWLLSPDVVAWVGASAQSTTEVFATATDEDAWAFVPIEQSVVSFGLAQIHLGKEPRMDVPAQFVAYPNGLNTAPAAAASLCHRSTVVFAEPANESPQAPQELVVATVGSNGVEPGQVIARARAFANVSLSAVPGGSLLAYTADHRTWAVSLRCRR